MANNDMKKVLGLPTDIEGFLDGKKRKAYPVHMKLFPELISALAKINLAKPWTNYLFEEGIQAITDVFTMCFPTHEVDEILDNLAGKNIKPVLMQLLDMNGIDIDKEEDSKNVAEV